MNAVSKRQEYNRAYRASESGKAARLKAFRKHNAKVYGYDYKKAEELRDSVAACMICGKYAAETADRVLYVDHDHKTGKIRGLLCGLHNKAIGQFQDSSFLLRRAADYLDGK